MVENNMVVLNKFIIYVLVYGVKTPAQGRRFIKERQGLSN